MSESHDVYVEDWYDPDDQEEYAYARCDTCGWKGEVTDVWLYAHDDVERHNYDVAHGINPEVTK